MFPNHSICYLGFSSYFLPRAKTDQDLLSPKNGLGELLATVPGALFLEHSSNDVVGSDFDADLRCQRGLADILQVAKEEYVLGHVYWDSTDSQKWWPSPFYA